VLFPTVAPDYQMQVILQNSLFEFSFACKDTVDPGECVGVSHSYSCSSFLSIDSIMDVCFSFGIICGCAFPYISYVDICIYQYILFVDVQFSIYHIQIYVSINIYHMGIYVYINCGCVFKYL